MIDDIRPPKFVEVECSVTGCGWRFWLEPLDSRLPDGPFYCADHDDDLGKCATCGIAWSLRYHDCCLDHPACDGTWNSWQGWVGTCRSACGGISCD